MKWYEKSPPPIFAFFIVLEYVIVGILIASAYMNR